MATSAEPDRTRARELAKESIAAGDPTGWFERLYQESEQGGAPVPWAELTPNPNLLSWRNAAPGIELAGRSALVVGCGLGDDAEQLSDWDAWVTAFDIAPTAIATAARRYPETKVDYQVADLLNPPEAWEHRFDFVFESYTIQALPVDIRQHAMEQVAKFVAPKGHLLIVARAREDDDPLGEIPWPLSKLELATFERCGLEQVSFEDYMDGATRRFRVLYRRL